MDEKPTLKSWKPATRDNFNIVCRLLELMHMSTAEQMASEVNAQGQWSTRKASSLPATPISWTEASRATLGCPRGHSLRAYGDDSLRSSSPGYKAKNALYPLFFIFLF